MPEPVKVFSPFSLPADSPAIRVYEAWRAAGGKVRDLMERALTQYGVSADYALEIEKLFKKEE